MFLALIIIIGIIVFIFEQKNKKSYQKVFDDFILQTRQSKGTKEEKITKIKAMLNNNGYEVFDEGAKLIATKKIFSLGLLLATLGLYYLYYLLLQQPHRIVIDKSALSQ